MDEKNNQGNVVEFEEPTKQEIKEYWLKIQQEEDEKDYSANVYEILFEERQPLGGELAKCCFENFSCKSKIKNEDPEIQKKEREKEESEMRRVLAICGDFNGSKKRN